MARTASKPNEERRAEILAVAEQRLLSGGYKNMSVDALALACGVSPAHLYNFFPAKIDIALALVEHEWQRLISQVRVQAKSGKAVGRLKRFLLAELEVSFTFLEEHPAYHEVLERIGRQRPQAANALLAAGRQYLVEILEAGCAEGSFSIADQMKMAETIQIAMLKFRFPQLITQLPLAGLRAEAVSVIDCLLKGIESR
ncbi:MAG: TetR/AcrR family transcriptional regulator [Rhodobiaceae bacterium]|nr:TetR/AcrR family transcriptional regulator [Rhodobiaceae bacterium]